MVQHHVHAVHHLGGYSDISSGKLQESSVLGGFIKYLLFVISRLSVQARLGNTFKKVIKCFVRVKEDDPL